MGPIDPRAATRRSQKAPDRTTLRIFQFSLGSAEISFSDPAATPSGCICIDWGFERKRKRIKGTIANAIPAKTA
jgi:hypothetical protein